MFLLPEEIDRKLNWKSGKAECLARQRRIPHHLLPDGTIRLVWDEIAPLIVAVPAILGQRRAANMPDAPVLSPLLLDARQAAALIGVSPATWHRMVSAGKTPSPIKLSAGCVRWRVSDLESWISHGCLDRKAWLSLKEGR